MEENQAGNAVVAAGGVIGAEVARGARSLAPSKVEDVAGFDDRSRCDGDVGSSKMG